MNETMADRASAWAEPLTQAAAQLGTMAANLIPDLVGAILLLLVGWGAARGLGWLVARALERLGFDRAVERLAGDALGRVGFAGSSAAVMGRVVYWIVLLAFLMGAAQVLGLDALTGTIERLFAYLPNVLSAAIIVVLGVSVARLVGDVVTSGAGAANLSYARQLGTAARGAFVVMVVVTVLEQLGVDTRVLQTAITAVLAMIAVGLGLSFAFGSGDVVRGILAGHYVRQSLEEGQEVSVRGRRGRVERIGPVETLFRDGSGSWSIPNAQLMAEVIER